MLNVLINHTYSFGLVEYIRWYYSATHACTFVLFYYFDFAAISRSNKGCGHSNKHKLKQRRIPNSLSNLLEYLGNSISNILENLLVSPILAPQKYGNKKNQS